MRILERALSAPAWLLCGVLLAAGCTTVPGAKPGTESAAAPAAADEAAPAPEQAKITAIEPVRPKIDLSEEILFKLLLAEFAGHRGQLDVAVENYLDLARSTRDPKVVERATRIAVYARDAEAATEAAQIWVELDPLNPDAHQILAVMSLRSGDPERALTHLQNILDYSHGELDQKLLMIANLLGREQDREQVLDLMERLVESRRDAPEALYAFAHIAARFGDLQRSRELLEQTLEIAPDNDNAALSYISVLQRQGQSGAALEWLEQSLPEREGNDFNLRMAYARLLTDARRFDDARRQFEILAVQAPNNNDVLYALGLLYLQANRLEEAETYFKRLADREDRSDDASYYLGRIEEDRGNFDRAAAWYQGVQRGENYFDAQVRLALSIAKAGRIEDARDHLQNVRTRDAEEKTIVIQAEGELLMEENRYQDAMSVYDQALEKGYNADLLYARAMLAEKMDQLDILERDLREILAQEPEHVQALNALGYTLADRTERYQEAHDLISRALELSPDDFYILDSMGWILYRLGRLQESVEYLRRAMSIRADPEIAAHLGEVLWVRGDREEAREVWEAAIQATPDDELLRDVIERFNP